VYKIALHISLRSTTKTSFTKTSFIILVY
jgi:hypothetical protein